MSSFLDEFKLEEKRLISFKLNYSEGLLKLETVPEDAHFAVLEINFNESSNPSFDITGPNTQLSSEIFNNYLDEEGTQMDLGNAWYNTWEENQTNPNIALCGPRKLIISNFDIGGWAKDPLPFCTYTTSFASFILSAQACNWHGEVIQGQIRYGGLTPGPDHPVQPQSSISNKYIIKKDNQTISSNKDYVISEDLELIDKKNNKKEKKTSRKNSNNYNHKKASIQNGNDFLKKLSYITKGGKRIIKRINASDPKKVIIPQKPRAVPNPPIAENYGTGSNRPQIINDEGTD